jgi:hypothetical protein
MLIPRTTTPAFGRRIGHTAEPGHSGIHRRPSTAARMRSRRSADGRARRDQTEMAGPGLRAAACSTIPNLKRSTRSISKDLRSDLRRRRRIGPPSLKEIGDDHAHLARNRHGIDPRDPTVRAEPTSGWLSCSKEAHRLSPEAYVATSRRFASSTCNEQPHNRPIRRTIVKSLRTLQNQV